MKTWIVRYRFLRSLRLPVFLTSVLCLWTFSGQGAIKTWTGNNPTSHLWSRTDNWDPAGAPQSGDDLIFPDPDIAKKEVNTNNLVNLRVRSITFQGDNAGYQLWGNAITLTNTLNAGHTSGANFVRFDTITLGAALDFRATAVLIVDSDVVLNGFDLTANPLVAGSDSIFLNGVISGTGNLIKNGLGTLQLGGTLANTFTGLTTARTGQLNLAKSAGRDAVPNSLVVGDGVTTGARVVWLQDNQIGSPGSVDLRRGAKADLNDHSELIGVLNMNGATVTTGTGTLGLGGNLTVTGSSLLSTIDGKIELNAVRILDIADGSSAPCDLEINAVIVDGGITKRGAGTLCLNGNNQFSLGVRVEAGELRINHDNALGNTTGATEVLDGASLFATIGVNNVRERLTIAGDGVGGTNGALRYLGGLNWLTNIVLSAPASIVSAAPASLLSIDAQISGVGPLTSKGDGTLRLLGKTANTFSGDLLALGGTVELGKTTGNSVPNNLVIGSGALLGASTATVKNLESFQISKAITVRRASLFDLNGFNESITSLTLSDGGDVALGTGVLTLFGDIQYTVGILALAGSSTIGPATGTLSLGNVNRTISVEEGSLLLPDGADLTISAQITGTGGIIKTGAGDLVLSGANSYGGVTRINDGEVWISNNTALGLSTAGTEVNGNAVLGITSDLVSLEPLTLNSQGTTSSGALHNISGVNILSGPITLTETARIDVESATTLRLFGAISGSQGITKEGVGTLEFRGSLANVYTGTTRVNEGKLFLNRLGANRSIQGPLVIGDGVGGSGADVVETDGADPQIGNGVPVTIATSGLLKISTVGSEQIGTLSGSGRLQIDGTTLTVRQTANSTYQGLISGTGGLTKIGLPQLILTGNNTYTGLTRVGQGALVVEGLQQSSDVEVSAAGSLSGAGRIGDLHVLSGGLLTPGSPVGTLEMGSLLLDDGSRCHLQLAGANLPNFDSLAIIGGTVTNKGCLLEVEMLFAPSADQGFIILSNGGIDPVQGIFKNLPNGSVVEADNGLKLRVNYNSPSGNDITLNVTQLALAKSSVTVGGGNLDGSPDLNECNQLTVSLQNLTTSTVTDIQAELSSPLHGILVTQAKSAYADIPIASRRSNLIPFQFSTLPGFTCGTNIPFVLEVSTAANGSFKLAFEVPSGSPGSPVRLNRSVAVPIPDAGSIESSVNVAGFSGHLAKVVVSLHIAHNQLDNLDLVLVAPNGTEVLLSSDNGGTANDYGTGCADAERTVFDSTESQAITALGALPPYVGRFRPEGSLAVFTGWWETQVNGTWKLRVTDDAPGGLGSLNCWSLFLHPAVCQDGGGICESCNGPFVGRVENSDPAMLRRLNTANPPSVCGAVKACPGLVAAAGVYRYDTRRFTNGPSSACVQVTVTPSSGSPIQSVAYTDIFKPGLPCENYLADSGAPSASTFSYRFNVNAGQIFEVVVQHAVSGASSDYTLSVDGFECPAPSLQIARADSPDAVVLSWSTAFPEFDLQRTLNLEGAPWLNVGTTPAMVGGKFNVTNTTTLPARYYRLLKP